MLASAFQDDNAVGVYLQLMQAAGRLDEAPEALQRLAADDTVIYTGRLRAADAAAYVMLGDDQAARTAVYAARDHWSATMPDVAARLDLVEALLAIAARDDDRAARLLRSLVDASDEHRRKAARPLLLAAGDNLAAADKPAAIEGARPLLEFLRAHGSPQTADWAATQLTRLRHTGGA